VVALAAGERMLIENGIADGVDFFHRPSGA
jgi:hypothetical protein